MQDLPRGPRVLVLLSTVCVSCWQAWSPTREDENSQLKKARHRCLGVKVTRRFGNLLQSYSSELPGEGAAVRQREKGKWPSGLGHRDPRLCEAGGLILFVVVGGLGAGGDPCRGAIECVDMRAV